jgi:hypothetical protein
MENKNIILQSITPQELTSLISESVKIQVKELLSNSSTKSSINEDDFLTRKDTALLFNVSVNTIHDWTNAGIIKVYKMGNRSYYKRTELLKTLFNSNTDKR